MSPAPVRVAIGTLVVHAPSPIEARRLADRLPAAIEQALATRTAGPANAPGPIPPIILTGSGDLAAAVAARIAAAVLPEGRR